MSGELFQLEQINDEIDRRQGVDVQEVRNFVNPKINQLPRLTLLTRQLEKREEELAQLRTTYYNLFKYSNIGFAEVALDGRFLRVNKALCRLTRRSELELLSLRWQDITMPEFINSDEENVLKLIESKSDETYTMYKEYFYYNGKGEKVPVPVELTVSCVYNKKEKLLYFISQAIDIERIYWEYIKKRGCHCGRL